MGKIIKNGIEYSGTVAEEGGAAVYVTTPEVTTFTPSAAWVEENKTSQVVKLEPNTNYSVVASAAFTEGNGEFRLRLTPEGGSTKVQAPYNAAGGLASVSAVMNVTTGSTGNVTVQTAFKGVKAGTRWSPWNIQFIPVSVPVKNPEHIYSTAEQEVGTWIDGKTIYRKTIDFGAMPNAANKAVAHGVSNINTVVKIEGVMVQGANAWAIPYMGVSILSVEGSNVTVRTTSDYSAFNAYVTIYYTKN